MAQSEVLSLVATAVDRATPVLQQVQKSLELVKRSAIDLDAATRQGVAGVQAYGNAMRGAGTGVLSFDSATRAAAAGVRGLSNQATGFAGVLNRHVTPSLVRAASAITAATISVAAFKNQLQVQKELSEFTKATAFTRDTIVGMRAAGQEFGVTSEKMDHILGDLSQKLQAMRFLGGGDFYGQILNVPELRETGGKMRAVMLDVENGVISETEGLERARELWMRGVRGLFEKFGEGGTREILRKVGAPPEWTNLARASFEAIAEIIRRFAAATKDLDPEHLQKFWEQWRLLSIELGNFTTAVLTPLLPKFTEFINLFVNPQLRKAAEDDWPKFGRDIATVFEVLKNTFQGAPIDWERVLALNSLVSARDDLQDIWNQIERAYETAKSVFTGSQAGVDAARKRELDFRIGRGRASESELYEREGLNRERAPLTAEEIAEADKQAADLKGAVQRRAEERARRRREQRQLQQQPQKFTDTQLNPLGLRDTGEKFNIDWLSGGDANIEDRRGDAPRAGVGDDKIRATRDLTEEIRKLNQNFMRGVGESFAAGTGGAVRFAPSDGDLRTGTGPGGGPPGGTIPGGGPPSGGGGGGGGGGGRRTAPPTITPQIPPQPKPVIPGPYGRPMPSPGTTVTGPRDVGGGIGGGVAGGVPALPGTPGGRALTPEERKAAAPPSGDGKQPEGSPGSVLYQKLLGSFKNSSLIGKVPDDGERFGIKTGSAEEWARFATAVANEESSFNPKTKNLTDPGGSFGIFQYAHKQVPGGNAYDVDASVKAFVRDAEASSKNLSSGILGRRISVISRRPERTIRSLPLAEKLATEVERRAKGAPAPTTAPPARGQPPAAPGAVDVYTGQGAALAGAYRRGDPNFLGSERAKQAGIASGLGTNVTTVDTAVGKITVNSAAAADIKGAIDELAAIGAPITPQSGSLAVRKISGSNRWSSHAYGGSVDVFGQSGRGVINKRAREWFEDPANRAQYNEILARRNMIGGEKFGDVGHIEWGGPGYGQKLAERANLKPGEQPPAVADRSVPLAAVPSQAPVQGLPGTPSGPAVTRERSPEQTVEKPEPQQAPVEKPATFAERFSGEGSEDLGDLSGLQYGGRARGRRPYIVGEGGPELFMPAQSGMVLPNAAMKYLKGLQIGGRSLGEYFDMAQSPGRLLSTMLGGGSPLSQVLGGLGGGGRGGGGNPLSSLMSGFGGGEGGGNPLQALSGLAGFQEGGAIDAGEEQRDLFENLSAASYEPGSLNSAYRARQKIEASGSIDVNIGSTGLSAIAKSEKSGLFENINMNRNLAEQHSSQRM